MPPTPVHPQPIEWTEHHAGEADEGLRATLNMTPEMEILALSEVTK